MPPSSSPFVAAGLDPRPITAGDTALVWLKRDLRLADHAPLNAAQGFSRALAVFIVEPAWLASPECEASHVEFALACIEVLRQQGLPVLVRQGEAVAVLEALCAEHGVTHLLSHEETGPGWTWDRDKAVAAWCLRQGVQWTEFPHTGVVRRLRSRNGWAGRWQARMDAAPLPTVAALPSPAGLVVTPLPTLAELKLAPHGKQPQAAGEQAGRQTLDAFLQVRGRDYRRALSSPLTAEDGCSRLSPHLAFGTLSMRTVHQATAQRIEAAAHSGLGEERAFAYALRGFAGRLRWHCHFMQKLEDEPAIEWRNFARSADGRALLVSFAAYHLWLHWRAPGLCLARQILDFEPGIHWSQMQMQSGTTGINTLRIYSPTKQMQDHDPQGVFVRRWVPEWGTDAYPAPIVDERAAAQAAKDRMYGLRKTQDARAEADHIQERHGSRLSGLPPSGRRVESGARPSRKKSLAEHPHQPSLFD